MIAFAKLESLLGPQAFGDSVVSKRHGSLAEADLRISGSSSAWCSAHNVSAAAGRMFEDPEPLRLLQPAPCVFGRNRITEGLWAKQGFQLRKGDHDI